MTEQRRFMADGKVLRAFMSDKLSRVKIIQGPVGSGTSSACCLHIYQQAMAQPKQRDGKQRFRAFVYRETYAKLEETTLRTWLDWFPEKEFGRFYQSKPFRHEIRVGSLELDVSFVAMEDIRDAKSHFKSLEPSLVWFNEGQFITFDVVREAVDRVSPPRYPAVKDGGVVWGGLILDTNAPPADHWIPIMRGDTPPPDWMTQEQRNALKKPDNWTFYSQPPGLIELFDERGNVSGYRENPDAENLLYLPKNFYMEKTGGQTKSWIDANIMNRSAVVVDGRPVYPLFRREHHVATGPLERIDGVPLIVGLDFGRQPAAILAQHLRGDWFIQREFIGRDMSAVEFAPQLKTYISEHYPDHTVQPAPSDGRPGVVFWGDPAGAQRGQANDTTPFDVFRQHGMMVRPAPNPQNKYSIRHEAMNAVLLRRSTSGRSSAMVIDPRCSTFITGMAGGYNMRRIHVTGERYADVPEKNAYSHVCEAGENAILGGGEGRSVMMHGSGKPKIVNVKTNYNPFKKKAVRGW
jgi:hypothetical protein